MTIPDTYDKNGLPNETLTEVNIGKGFVIFLIRLNSTLIKSLRNCKRRNKRKFYIKD